MFNVHASGFARVTLEQVWQVLTDYQSLPRFVPDLVRSRVVSRNGPEAIVEQESRAGFLFLTQTIRLVLRITEQPMSRIDVALVSGGMLRYDAQWELAPGISDAQGAAKGTQIRFSGAMEPAFYVPAMVGNVIAQAGVSKTVYAVIAEIERRAAAGLDAAN